MKKKSASQSAFFNLRVLIGLFIVLAGVFLALAGFGVAQAQQKNSIITNSTDPLVPNGFDCSRIHELGIDKQENFRAGAIMIACGRAQGGSASPLGAFSQAIQAVEKLWTPLVYGTADVDLITGTETFPHVTQSETFTVANPDNPLQVLAAYNDSRGLTASPINISGASYSSDGGNTFTRLTAASGQSPFPNTVGDPVVLYNRPTATWFTVWLDRGCGAQGLGGFKSTTPGDPSPASWTHFCIYNEASADRESGWADNNPASPFYGHMYVSWNDFAIGGGALFVRVSTDNGATWTPHQITTGFTRDVQITGDLVTGDVYIAGMNEGGGGTAGPRSNLMFRSTDGGTTWTNTYTGPTFTGPSDGTVCFSNSYFAAMFTGYWRHMGWGEPAAINHVVHYVYAQHGAGSDPSDVYYIRSTDSGMTFSAPLKLNTDATARPQWQPNLSVSPSGTVFAVWYDARESASCTRGNPAVPCYRMWGRKSNDNGVTWLADDMFSDVVTPLPAQPDAGIVGCYAGDYDYGSATTAKHVTSWVDGRVTISGQSQQDAFTDREPTSPCGQQAWVTVANYPVVLESPAVGTDGTYAYSAGGRVGGGPSNGFYRYDAVANAWTSLASLPVSLYDARAAYAANTNSFYVFGGYDGTNVLNTTQRYNVGTNTWSTGAPMPAGRYFPNVAYYGGNGKIYVTGGFDPSFTEANQTWEYDPVANTWNTSRANIPVAMAGSATSIVGQYIYLVGSWNGGSGSTFNYRYDIINNTWASMAALPAPVYEAAGAAIGGKTYVFGGGNPFAIEGLNKGPAGTLGAPNAPATSYNTTYIYDIAGNSWTSGPNMNAAHSFTGGTAIGNHLLVVAGYDGTADTNTVEMSTFNSCAPMAQSAFSRKVHGGAGTFDVPLPLTGNVGVECRSGGATNDYQMIINFATSVTVGGAAVTSGTGSVSTFSVSGSQVTVNLTGVTNVQRITVTLFDVNDGTHMGDVPISMGVLIGDVNGNAVVNASDVSLTKSQVGQTVTSSNFREDVNVNGTISATDVALVKSDVGTALPP